MKIFIKQLSFKCIIGILPHERIKKQKVLIDATFNFDGEKMSINYAKVARDIKKIFKQKRFYTIEESLVFTQKELKKNYPDIKKIKLNIYKPQALKNCIVGVGLNKKY